MPWLESVHALCAPFALALLARAADRWAGATGERRWRLIRKWAWTLVVLQGAALLLGLGLTAWTEILRAAALFASIRPAALLGWHFFQVSRSQP